MLLIHCAGDGKMEVYHAKQTANWKAQHIVRILDDRRYIGDYVGGHTEKLRFKSKKRE